MRVLPGAQWIWLLQTDELPHMMTVRCLDVTCLSRHRLWWFPHLTVPAPPQSSSHWLIVRPLWRIHNSQIVNGGGSLSRILLNICVRWEMGAVVAGTCVSCMCTCRQFHSPQFELLVIPLIGSPALRQKPHQSWRAVTGSSVAGTRGRAVASLEICSLEIDLCVKTRGT